MTDSQDHQKKFNTLVASVTQKREHITEEQEQAFAELVKQAQELDMGYGDSFRPKLLS
ncbi:putative ATP-dependent protease [Pseudomonas nitritireducens]|uniref:Putative ATP-dependent protease n=1 Tax=Pseudomonas nitroreducens TaxID=46680 RepID=A0A7W7P4G1_PSENT|nr:hypothetical protein [Pseudomonas nitritireducens]MBB4866854.1 putative ATP-dependent protease [Pseudomonas nitritireducens]